MTVRRLATRLLLRPQDVPASRDDFEVVGAFNPAAVRVGDEVVLLVRVAERPKEILHRHRGLPRWDPIAGLTVDWVHEDEHEEVDRRVLRHKRHKLVRLVFASHLRVVRCGDGLAVREVSKITFAPQAEFEEYGVEDPRVTELDGRYYITYVAVSRHGPATALASTADFLTFERHGIIFCPENKDVALFPEPVCGEYVALHRPMCATLFTRPEMWLARSSDRIHWGEHEPILMPGAEWQSGRVGAGAPPIRVDEGWLAIYHGNRQPARPGDVGAYYAGAMMLDADDPKNVTRFLPEPLFAPETDFEISGFVPNVVFPTGVVRNGGSLLVYYGAADTCVAVVEFAESELIETLCSSPPSHRSV